ncbi:MAG: MBL fold metallo-hydrolase [Methanomicrobiales archaeon]|nr:MBL fold metallo-hydrolase [Methanomicrobiales archaeon]
MKVTVLASGSKGNCIYIEGASGALLIDAGLSARQIRARLSACGESGDRIEAIVVTHEHTDHIRGADSLARSLDVPVIATEGTLREYLEHRRTSGKPLRVAACRSGEPHAIGDFSVTPFSVFHDAADPCGFIVREHDAVFGCCTDTGCVNDRMLAHLRTCDAIVLESNHCPQMLEQGPYPLFLKRRIRDEKRGHLSNAASAACLGRIADSVHTALLAHLSEVNNTPDRAMVSAIDGLGLYAGSIRLGIAPQHTVSETIEL